MSSKSKATTYPCPPIGVIAVREVQARHAHEMAEVVAAARAVSNLPDGSYALDLSRGVWTVRNPNGE